MQALILAGGIGKRLKPITDYVPKSLVPIYNIPIIEWQIRYFKKFGVTKFIICAGYKNEQIINYLDTKKNFGTKIDYSIEKTPLGTGGAIRNANSLVEENDFFVINGDIITNLDPRPLKSKPNTISVVPLKTAFGIVDVKSGQVRRFKEKPRIADYWMNAGVYYLSKKIIPHLPKKGNIENTALPLFATKSQLFAVKYHNVFWHSIDSHKDIEECVNGMKAVHYEDFIFKK